MRIFEDLLAIKQAFPMDEGEPFAVSMSELAELLYCSQRNVKNLLMKMEQSQWISFASGKGRGHMTVMTYLLSKEAILQQIAESYVKEGNIAGAADFLKQYSEEEVLTSQFLNWLSNYFGVSVVENVEMLKLPIYRAINTLDPAEAYYSLDSHLVTQVFDTLVKYNFETKEIEPSLSHHWEVNVTGTEWTFHLRKRVYFHDGKELTSADVQNSLERLRDDKLHWVAANIAEIEAISRYSVKIFLYEPNYLLLHFLSYTPCSIVSKVASRIGTGPYKALSQNADTCVFEAHDRYFSGRAFIDRIEILRVPDITGFEPKFHLLTVNTGETEKSTISDWGEEELLCGTSVLTLNAKKTGPLQDRNFRKALYHLINREELAEELGGPRYCPAHSFQLDLCERTDDVMYDWKEALEALQASSYDGEILHLYTYERHLPDALWLQEKYKRFGIALEITILPWKDLLNSSIIERADFIL
ncbi:MAG: ABC transporter substrate-binding protein, partial [Bacillota bacterium]|nr:ABC transporter substrate-binding protein [Bacillota bacterium]